MFLKRIVNSNKLASEVAHWRRLKDTDSDRTYKWLRESVENVIRNERKDKNNEALQRAHRPPIGSTPLLLHRELLKKLRQEKVKQRRASQEAPPRALATPLLVATRSLRNKCLVGYDSCSTTARKEASVTMHTGTLPQMR